MTDITPEILQKIKEAVEAHKHVQRKGINASVSFHEKLAVLSAGSLALAISGAAVLYQKPLTNAQLAHLIFVGLTVSVGLVWLSLVASLVHNFMELYALHLDSEFEENETVLTIYKIILEMPEIRQKKDEAPGALLRVQEMIETPLKAKQRHQVFRALKIRKCEIWVSAFAITMFAFGYLFVVVYVLALFHNPELNQNKSGNGTYARPF